MPPLFKSILVPLDGSDQAERVLPWVRRHAKPGKAEVILLQVLQLAYPLEDLPFPRGAPEAQRYLQGIERQFNYDGIPAKIVLRGNAVAGSILSTALSERCDLIALTSGHTSRTVRWLLGGIAEQVLRLSPIPVFVLRNGITGRVRLQPRNLIVPLDGSRLSRTALPLAEQLARFHRARLVLVHVGDSPRTLHRLSRIREGLQRRKVRTVLRVETGDPADRIAASALPSDLLLLTTHGRGGLKRLILGSVAERVVREALCPVLVYKEALA